MNAPTFDRLLLYFDHGLLNPSAPTERVKEAMEPLFAVLAPLAPLEKNDETKAIWIKIPRGDITDYDSFEELKGCGEVSTYEEYVQRWKEEYPDDYKWYELIIVESFGKDGKLRYRGVALGYDTFISAIMDGGTSEADYSEDAAVELCGLLVPAAEEALQRLRDGTYNDEVRTSLPYEFRTGVVRRSAVWKVHPEYRDHVLEGLSETFLARFKELQSSGVNDEIKIGRIARMTANDFFRACAIGYKACGYKDTDLPLVDQYFRHADGRDEGLSGRGYGLGDGPGIDFDDPDAWDRWYFHRDSFGGHPWEVCRGGNSTHVDLFVRHDENSIRWKVQTGRISQEEADRHPCGYFFEVAGKHRAAEAVNFYVAISAAGLPVVLNDAEEILARFEATDYIGIVPHARIPKYCESMFPAKYGRVIDFTHVYDEELEEYGDAIEWLPEAPAALIE